MAMAKKAVVKKTVAKKTVAKKTVKKADNWSNDMTKGQKSAARKAFSRNMNYDMGGLNDVVGQDRRMASSSKIWSRTMGKYDQAGRQLIKQSKKSAKKAAANPSDVKAARSSGYSKAAAVKAYAAATRRSTNRKRGE